MKIIKLLLLGFSFFLVACTTTHDLDKKENEKITALLLSNDKLYAVGEVNDYEFSGEIVKELYLFSLSPYADKLIYSTANLTVTDKKSVNGTYRVYIAVAGLSDIEKKELIDKYHFNVTQYLPKAATTLPSNAEKPEFLMHSFRSNGNIVALENKHALTEKYALRKPLIADVNYFISSKDIAGDMGAVLMAPVAIIMVIPVMLVWGVACAGSSDGC
ncbi:hypothetical protein [Proteus hauseri]|uniref:hypothetical protein n=1 Tax=Proteus hauseri TaxID=183417 RepID=UPI0010094738|nr:hypothetical protein [Proteus hauseri]QAV21865.1 hypothetical protein PH4a_00230 [Proteus hauseri]